MIEQLAMNEIMIAAVVAVVTGVVTGVFSSIGTVSSLKVHIQYIKESLDKHDARLLDVEKEQHRIAGAVGVENNQSPNVGAR